MKPNNSMLGGAMRKQSFDPYARYFVKFLEGYKADGRKQPCSASGSSMPPDRRSLIGAWEFTATISVGVAATPMGTPMGTATGRTLHLTQGHR